MADSRTFRRLVGAISVVAGSICFALPSTVSPVWVGEAAGYLQTAASVVDGEPAACGCSRSCREPGGWSAAARFGWARSATRCSSDSPRSSPPASSLAIRAVSASSDG